MRMSTRGHGWKSTILRSKALFKAVWGRSCAAVRCACHWHPCFARWHACPDRSLLRVADNKINGLWSCENPDTLGDLRDHLNFSGFVVSDWGATHSTSIAAGLDMEMPSSNFINMDKVSAGLASGNITKAEIDAAVLRQLVPMFSVGLFDYRVNDSARDNNVTSAEHTALAREISENSTILLKNEGILPLSTASVKHIAVLGWGDGAHVMTHGGGSGEVSPCNGCVASPYQAIRRKLGIRPAGPIPDCMPSRTEAQTLYTDPKEPPPPFASCNLPNATRCAHAMTPELCCNLCSQRPHCARWSFAWTGASSRADVSEPRAPRWGGTCYFHSSAAVKSVNASYTSGSCQHQPLPPGRDCAGEHCATFNAGAEIDQAVALAKAADTAIVFVATTSAEGSDRGTLALKDNGDALVAAVVKANPRTVVVVSGPGAVLMPWADDVEAVLINFMPGQEGGNAIVRVLFGDVDPSGKLPITIPNRDNEVEFTQAQYPGVFTDPDDPSQQEATYSERLEVGYRWYDAHGKSPLYPFVKS